LGSEAISGASGTGVSVAISVAISISNVTTNAQLLSGSSVTSAGPVSLLAASSGETTTKAIPHEDVEGGDFGMGGSVAIGLITDHAIAEVQGGVTFGGTLGALSLSATGGHSS